MWPPPTPPPPPPSNQSPVCVCVCVCDMFASHYLLDADPSGYLLAPVPSGADPGTATISPISDAERTRSACCVHAVFPPRAESHAARCTTVQRWFCCVLLSAASSCQSLLVAPQLSCPLPLLRSTAERRHRWPDSLVRSPARLRPTKHFSVLPCAAEHRLVLLSAFKRHCRAPLRAAEYCWGLYSPVCCS
jgi:hypothetical protein